MEKMVIMQIIPTLNEGGAERFVVDLSNSLASKGNVELHLVVFFDIEKHMFLAQDINSNVKLHTLGKKLGFDYRIIFKLNKLVQKIKPDVINTHLASFEYNILNLLTFKGRYFHTLHSDATKECANKRKRELRKIFYRKNRIAPITISKESSNSYRKIYNLSNDTIIYNGRSKLVPSSDFLLIEEEFNERYRITPDTQVILNIGSIQGLKNQYALAKAVDTLTKEGNDVVLLIIGGMRADGQKIYDSILALNNPRILLLGVKSNIQDYLLLSDVFCLSSSFEGMPISLIEAFSTRCLAACTPVGGIVNMIEDGVSGLLARNDSVDGLVDLLKHSLLLTAKDREEMVDKAFSCFEKKYSIEFCSDQYLQLYINKTN